MQHDTCTIGAITGNSIQNLAVFLLRTTCIPRNTDSTILSLANHLNVCSCKILDCPIYLQLCIHVHMSKEKIERLLPSLSFNYYLKTVAVAMHPV